MNSNARRSAGGTTAIPVDTRTHVAAVVRGPTDMDLYIDGVPEVAAYSGAERPLVYLNNAAEIGGDPSHSQTYFGDIDEVRRFSRELSESDIMALPEPSLRLLLLAGVSTLGALGAQRRRRARNREY